MSETNQGEGPAAGVAIVGMAGRFPGAPDVERFWENLVAGVESITRFPREELLAAGLDPALVDDPAYVPARAAIPGAELFDAGLFGYSPREAEVMDPQHRLLLECAWEALEHAGCDPRRFPGLIGVYAGSGANGYLWHCLAAHPELLASVGEFQTLLGNGIDFLATRLSYKLGLKGPSLTVQTACSTSLVAVHLAVQSLLNGECDLALAGGVRISVPRPAGYLHQADGVLSPDGRCRPFDAAGAGTVDGEGAAMVVLKRLADAQADGDRVHAVILGTAINNDGDARLGFTAPGVEGQAAVVAMAQAVAGVDPDTLGFIEAHGTATPLGDPIELAALSQVFAGTGRRGFCALGSVKGNVGHMDAAAGAVSLIKAALALERGVIPPTPGFERPNPRLGLAESPFFVNTEPLSWPRGHAPRRAAVSSFGVGGTNAHAVLEEAPPVPPSAPAPSWQLLVLSAAGAPALEEATDRLASHLARNPGLDLADVAFTLQVGRQELAHRRALVCRSPAEAAAALAARDARVLSGILEAVGRPQGPPLVPQLASSPEDLDALARHWLAGATIDWPALHGGNRRKVVLPSYPFQHRPYWIGKAAAPTAPPRAPVSPDPVPQPATPPRPAVVARKPRPLGTPYVEPRTAREQQVAHLYEELLGYAPAGSADEFFEMGGHSVLGLQLLSRVKAELGAEVRLEWLFQASSVMDLAGLLDLIEEERAAAGADAASASGTIPLAPRGQDLPLSPAQERLWFLDRMDPGTPSLNLTEPVILAGVLDVPALAGALAEVVRRHEALRTSFHEAEGRPVQRILPAVHVPLPLVDLAALPAARREAEAVRLATRAGGRRFDLARPPLLAAELYRLGPERHGLALVLHHIVGDGWSSVVLLAELAEIYAALTAGRPSPLAPLPVQYADFAVWQRARLGEEELAKQVARWRERLAPLPPPLELPTDRPRPSAPEARGASEVLVLPPAEGADLRALAAAHGATPFMVLLAGFAHLLARWSGQEDLVVGAPMAGRDRRELEGLIGVFLNLLPLRLDLSGDPPFAALVDRVRAAAVDAYAGQEVPVERLIAELAPARDLSRPPLFQVLFNLQAFPERARGVPGLTLEPFPLDEVPARFDLTVYAEELADGAIHLDLVYAAHLFDRATMAEFLAQLGRLLARAAAAPDTLLSRISLAAPAALPAPRAPRAASEVGEAVHERFFAGARRHPERPAVVEPAGTWTYGELAERAGGLTGRLRQAGVRKGDVVAVHARRRAPLVQALLGVLAAGAAFLVLDPAHPAPRLRAALRQARPRAWIETGIPGTPETAAAELTEVLPGLPVPLDGRATGELPVDLPRPADPGDLAYVAFTSGSTGEPKGILGTHGPLAHFTAWQAAAFGLGADDRVSLLSGLAHDPLLRDVFTPLVIGASVCIPDPDDLGAPTRLAAWMARSRITVCHLTPAFGQILAEGGTQLPALRHAFFGGDVLTEADVTRLRTLAPAAAVTNFYGTTETPQAMAWHDASDLGDRPSRPVPVGRGIDGVDLLVWNAAGEPAAPGELGEVVVRTSFLSLGYLGDGALTARRYGIDPATGERLYRTGDLGRYRADGAVVLAGRADAQVQVRGLRVEPAEVEAALALHPAVRQAAVGARAGASGRPALTAWLVATDVTEGSARPRAAELRDFLLGRLPEAMVPEAWVWLPVLPLTPNGKLDRRALPEPVREEPVEGAFEAPANPLEEEVAALWGDLLALDRVGRHDNFFELGGHSLLAVRAVAELRERFGVELPLRVLFGTPTVAAVAAAVTDGWLEQAGGSEMGRLLEDLDGLSEEEAEALLAGGDEGSAR